MKICKKCGQQKQIKSFYKHKAMADGHLNICIDCVKSRVTKHRNEYDKNRAMLPHRVKARAEYAKTERGKISKSKALKNYREKFPIKYEAHVSFCNAVRNGKVVVKEDCENCGSNNHVQGHHDDYNKPLEVRWLCVKCHVEWHKYNKPLY